MAERIETPQEEHVVYEFFLWSVLAKGAISLAEMVCGIAVLFIPPALIVSLALSLLNLAPVSGLQNELMQEVAKYTSGTVTFVALYLFSRGAIKAALIFALLRNRLWAYPWSLAVLGAFLAYQAYQILTAHSLIVVGITLFDLVVMYFIWREWRIVKRHRGASVPA